ncbi:hypothetical protein GH733_016217 [Mirounga leonina]|nr:hypothetical protein GH733_016217 [Mirounga leonina]
MNVERLGGYHSPPGEEYSGIYQCHGSVKTKHSCWLQEIYKNKNVTCDGLKGEEMGDFKDDHQIYDFSSQAMEVPFSELGKSKDMLMSLANVTRLACDLTCLLIQPTLTVGPPKPRILFNSSRKFFSSLGIRRLLPREASQISVSVQPDTSNIVDSIRNSDLHYAYVYILDGREAMGTS